MAGLEGMLVPSFASSAGVNLAVFPDKLRPGSLLRAEGVTPGN